MAQGTYARPPCLLPLLQRRTLHACCPCLRHPADPPHLHACRTVSQLSVCQPPVLKQINCCSRGVGVWPEGRATQPSQLSAASRDAHPCLQSGQAWPLLRECLHLQQGPTLPRPRTPRLILWPEGTSQSTRCKPAGPVMTQGSAAEAGHHLQTAPPSGATRISACVMPPGARQPSALRGLSAVRPTRQAQ